MFSYEIKKMETADEIDGKGYVHYKSWQEAYAGLIDADYLENKMTLEKCIAIAHKWPDNLLVAKDGEKVVGFVGYGKYRDDTLADCGEVFSIYVLADYYDKKIGYELMNAAFEKLSAYSKIAVWVLKGNERAIRFYERYGFRFDGTEQEIMLGTPNTELRMIYTKSQEQIVQFTRRAADHGDRDGQCNLAWFHEDGIGVERDMEQAIFWYRKAALQDHDLAIEKCKELDMELRKLNNEVARMLDSTDIDRESARAKMLECLSQKYQEIDTAEYTTKRLVADFTNAEPLTAFSADLLGRVADAVILHTDQSVSIILTNGQIIGKELPNGTNHATAESGQSHTAYG